MSQLVECVPNFSEGRNQEVIDAISQAVTQTPGCVLLDVDTGPSTNRTVYTFVGRPQDVVEGALNAARAASRLIDMRRHKGEHPRMGALDVCPFIPVRGVTMDECVLCAQAFGQQLAEELGVPVYLYGEAAQTASRRTLPAIRAGEYEALPEKLKQTEWAPDFGPSNFVPSWGATVTGARKFLIAFNINLLSTKEQAHRIALNLREQGRGEGQPGRLKKVQGIGWYLDEKSLAQVSTNLLDFEVTGLHTVYEETCREAQELSLPVVGSQLVGLVPLKALLDVASFYCEKENLFVLEEEQRMRLVVSRLGLDSLSPFNPKERVIEYLVPGGPEQSLVDKPLRTFIREVGARSAAPGGGSVAAACAALGAALACMVGLMTYGRRQFEALDAAVRRLVPPLHAASAALSALVDADARAFEGYLDAMKLPKNTAEERDRRMAALQEGLRRAVAVPMQLAETVASLWPVLQELALCGNPACRSDLQVAAKALEMGVFGAYFNVLVNLTDIADDEFKEQVWLHAAHTCKHRMECRWGSPALTARLVRIRLGAGTLGKEESTPFAACPCWGVRPDQGGPCHRVRAMLWLSMAPASAPCLLPCTWASRTRG
ncbi:formimidoyltransferase-cyclodeaminase isoform X1 [Manis javanica]|uniref:formimidoyltransferase-cyclodeaminase isoform X1 n=1 Tax=Manis javanica TaxID=9974 RepID=UPI001879B5F2|nr:formimidoyltransferase-cyclodeaminase isoform X2 [Manis javanica]